MELTPHASPHAPRFFGPLPAGFFGKNDHLLGHAHHVMQAPRLQFPAHLPDRSQPRLRFACIFGHRADQTIDTDQWDRMGQFYASLKIKTGHVTASVALKRLVGFSAKNRFYRANRDLGRIFKTEFILQYLSEPELALLSEPQVPLLTGSRY